MGFLDAVLGRKKPPKNDLDALFAVPSAAVTLEAATGFAPTGIGAVCYRSVQGGAMARTEGEVQELLAADGRAPERVVDSYGFTWLVSKEDPLDALVTELHAVNSTLVDNGFGSALLCSVVGFRAGSRRLGLVYLFKRGTFYPFAPLAGEKRDNAVELEVRGALSGELTIEPDLSRWFPVWGAPGV
jgi:hypothetical protein